MMDTASTETRLGRPTAGDLAAIRAGLRLSGGRPVDRRGVPIGAADAAAVEERARRVMARSKLLFAKARAR